MAFYEYLLGDKLEKEEEDEEENVEEAKQQHDDDDDDDDDDDERATTTNATSDAEDDTCSGSSNNNQSLSNKDDKEDDSSIDTQEFLNQHDDACDVCYMGGELICCTTCSLVFHRECLRPISKTEPIDWNCPHCIIQGLGGYKRHSKTWKRAEAGARQMKRMRIEKVGGEQEEEDEEKSRGKILQHVKREKKKKKKKNTYEKEDGTKKEKNNPKTKSDAATTTTKSKTIKSSQSLPKKERKDKDKDIQNSNTTTNTATVGAEAEASNKGKDDVSIASATSSCDNNFNNNNKKKRSNLALYKIADSYTPHCTESQLVKGRRNRKQPALYQPQLCADSRWKSDEKIDGEKINDDDDNNYDDDDDDDDNDDSIEDGDNDDHDDDKDDDDDDGDYQDNDIVDDNKSKKEEPKKETDSIIRMEVETDNKIKEDCNVHKKDNDDIQVQQKVQNDEKVIACVDGVIIGDKKKTSTTIWCNFCRDDPNIPICVFCGCRRCFGKHDKASLLLCDKCDEEYHTHCLGLTTVPLTQVWFCPNCEKKKKAVADLDSPRKSRTVISTYATDGIIQSDSSPTLDSPSRKDMSASSTTKTPKSTQTVKTPKSTSTVKTPKLKKSTTKIKVEGKKPRGRPPKNKDKIPASTPGKRGPKPKVKSASKSTPVPGRKRGRPRKEVNPTKALKLLAIAGPPRKRGRPRKVEIQPEPSAITGNLNAVHVPGKKRGPKPKPSTVTSTTTTTTSSTDTITDLRVETESEAPTTQEPIKVSRISGRVVKRASFHDEIDGGEQHLRGRSLTPKSQEAQMHRSKVPESEPRKKQKVVKNKEDSATIQITAAPSISESKPAKSRKIPKIQDKEDEMVDHLPPVAPVRMKPVLQSPAPAMWPPSETTTEDAYNLTNVTARENTNDPLIATASAITDPGAAHKTQPSLTPLSGTNQPLVVAAKAVDPINVYPGPSTTAAHELPRSSSNIVSNYPSTPLLDPAALEAAVKALPVSDDVKVEKVGLTTTKSPRRKPGARECMQICRRFGVDIIPENHMNVLLDYCRRGKVEQLIRMRERLDCHSRFLESQLAGLEGLVMKVGESNVVVPALPDKFEPAKSIGAGAVESNNITSTLPALSTVVNIHSTKIAATISASTSTNVSIDLVNEKMPASVQN